MDTLLRIEVDPSDDETELVLTFSIMPDVLFDEQRTTRLSAGFPAVCSYQLLCNTAPYQRSTASFLTLSEYQSFADMLLLVSLFGVLLTFCIFLTDGNNNNKDNTNNNNKNSDKNKHKHQNHLNTNPNHIPTTITTTITTITTITTTAPPRPPPPTAPAPSLQLP